MTVSRLHWGILGTGHIARLFAQGIEYSASGRLTAVGSRNAETARAFAREFDVGRSHGSYGALLADPEVQVVYIATPHSLHAEWAIRAARAGKHILCEKPLAVNARDAAAIIEAARANQVFLMEAFMYRCHPQTHRLLDLLRTGRIGAVRSLQATFSYPAPQRIKDRLFDPALGGGGILDVGCYAASMARLIAGAATEKPFAEPFEFRALGGIDTESGVDEWAAAIAVFPGGLSAQLATGIRERQDNTVRIYGSDGWIHLTSPWQPGKFGGEWSFLLHQRDASEPEIIGSSEPRSIYTVEVDHVGDQIRTGRLESPAVSWEDTLGNMRLLDRWRQAIGLTHPAD